MRSDILATLQAANTEAASLYAEPYTRGAAAYSFTGRQLTDIEASEGGYEITQHGRRNRQVWLLVGDRSQFANLEGWVGTKLTRSSTGQLLTVRAVDSTSDPLNINLIAVTS